MGNNKKLICPFTGSTQFQKIFEYDQKPEEEIAFVFNSTGSYHREIWQCKLSKHYLSIHAMDMTDMYSSDYVKANYEDEQGIHRKFEKIMALPATESDNMGRVRAVVNFFKNCCRMQSSPSLLDIGSGLGVFPFAMKNEGWDCTALDPDEQAVKHLRDQLGVKIIHGDFNTVNINEKYDAIFFNKVLEHVADPIAMLARCKDILNPNGFIYVEVPDGEMAESEGKEHEEFFIDHIHIFSFLSVSMLAQKAGFVPVFLERLQEPSTKYTLRLFLKSNFV